MATLPISIFILTLNEADRIGRTIAAVAALSADIVVVDSGSSDGTREIAASLGARVIQHEWIGYGAQKNFAQDQCQCDWVFNLDADEVATSELCDEIRALFEKSAPSADAYAMRIVDVFPGDSRPRAFAHAYNPVRLYRKTAGRFSPSIVHDRVELLPDSNKGQLRGKIHHFSMRGIGEQLTKFNTYTDAQVSDLRRRNVSIPVWRIFVEFPVAFLKAYVLRGYFMGGRYGFLIAMNYAIFRHIRVAKFYEASRGERKLP